MFILASISISLKDATVERLACLFIPRRSDIAPATRLRLAGTGATAVTLWRCCPAG